MFEDELADLAARHGLSDAAQRDLRALLRRSGVTRPGGVDPDATTAPTASGPDPATPRDPKGRYTFGARLGEGGMGLVYQVHDRELNRSLAMKVIRKGALKNPESLSRFIGEAQATAQLQHPGIVPVHELGQLEDGRWYYTMPQIRGVTLTTALRAVHRASVLGTWTASPEGWTLRRLIDAFRSACEAMGYAHSRGVVHRDLKPENVMLGPHGEVLVLDWGIAKILSDPADVPDVVTQRSLETAHQTAAGAVAGTPAYMPPEQAMGEVDRITPAADVWALGATLFEILHGHPPYGGRSGRRVLMDIVRGPPTRPDDEAGPRAPDDLVEIWIRAMAPEPEDRFADAGVLAREVASWLDGAKRREQARAVVASAEGIEPEVADLRARATELREQARELLDPIEPWEPEERKLPGWELEDRAEALEARADKVEFRSDRLLHGALTHDPDLLEAHLALARRTHRAHASAEAHNRPAAAFRAEERLRAHVDALPESHPERARFQAYLSGTGALTLRTDPPGARVELFRYRRSGRRLVPVRIGDLGTTPIHEQPLPMGSYLLEIRAEGCDPVRYPVAIARQQHWDGVPPGETEPLPIRLPRSGELGPDDCYVPAGWFWVGGDPAAEVPAPRRRAWADGFVMQRFPVTNRRYLAFLDALVAAGREEDALAWAPRERSGSASGLGALVYGRTDGRFTLVPDSEGDMWDLDWPVLMVDHACARGYAAWLAETTGRPWTLPAELQWEKAARGVDGRIFPWGDLLDPCWCCMDDSHAGRRLPAPVDTFPVDVSVYGVRGLAGNVQDWCADLMLPGERELPERIVCVDPVVAGHEARMNARGGTWTGSAQIARCTGRQGASPAQRMYTRSIRVVAPFQYGSTEAPNRAPDGPCV